MSVIVLLPILFFSIVLHEFAHGYTAYRMGDETAYFSGRLTLNPLKHIDVMGTLVVPALCYFFGLPLFGWAKPVPVNPVRLPSPRRDMGKVALAGPAVNLLLAFIFAGFIKGLLMLGGKLETQTVTLLFHFLHYGLFINILLAVFNLIPIPPLDGGRVLCALLPVQQAIRYDQFFNRYGMWIVFLLILSGAVRYILIPPTQFILALLGKIFGL